MARSGFTTSNYLEYANNAWPTAYPATVSCWMNPASLAGAEQIAASAGNTGSGSAHIGIGINSSNNVELNFKGAVVSSALSLSTNTWYHACGVMTTTTSRDVYVNGGNSGSSVTSASWPSLNRSSIGVRHTNAGITVPFSGAVAEVTVWNVALTTGEISALAAGVRAYRVRPAAIVAYWPCYGLASPEPDFSGKAHNMSITGSLSLANGPPVTVFTPRWHRAHPLTSGGAPATHGLFLRPLLNGISTGGPFFAHPIG